LAAVVALAACDNERVIYPHDGGTTVGDGGFLRLASLKGVHLASCEDPACGNGSNPPLGGDHCPVALSCRKHDAAQSRCSWIHNLEHGHAVLAYNCPTGCAELVAKLNAVWDAQQANPSRKRILVTPDSKLPFKMAAIVWGFGWQGNDFDEGAVSQVLSHQDEEAPEAFLGCAP
jgi:hypothetical protein